MSNKKEIHTFVFQGEMDRTGNPFAAPYLGMEPVAWAQGQALEAKDKLEDFIRDLAFGEFEDMEDAIEAARDLMKEMNWG